MYLYAWAHLLELPYSVKRGVEFLGEQKRTYWVIGYISVYTFNFTRCCELFFKMLLPNGHSYQYIWEFRLLCTLAYTWHCQTSKFLHVWWVYLLMVLICISLSINEVGYFFMSLMGLWVFFFFLFLMPCSSLLPIHVSSELSRGFLSAFLRVLHTF